MRIVIPKQKLEELKPCREYYLESPEWNGEALVYEDWDASAKRLLSTSVGRTQLSWLVKNGLVPMTNEEFVKARRQISGAVK